MESIISSVHCGELVTVPDVHPMLTVRHFIVAPWKQPAPTCQLYHTYSTIFTAHFLSGSHYCLLLNDPCWILYGNENTDSWAYT